MLYRKPGYKQWRKGSGTRGRQNLKSWFSLLKKGEGDKMITSTPGRKIRSRELKVCRFSVQAFQEEKQTAPDPGQDNYLRSCHFLLFFLLLCVFSGDIMLQTHNYMLRKYLQMQQHNSLTCNCCSEQEEKVFLVLSPFSELFSDFLCSCSG